MIKLDEHFSIDSDNYCWILNYKRETDVISKISGRPQLEQRTTYHGSLKTLFNAYKEQCLKGCSDLTEVFLKLEEVEKTIERVAEGIKRPEYQPKRRK